MTTIRIPHNWHPRPYQVPLWEYLEGGGKRAVAVWHRRAGKDDVCLRWASVAAMTRPATYWHMLPEASQARKAVWDAVNPHSGKRRIDEAFPPEIRETTREQEMMIRFKTGSTWQVCGSDNFNSLVGSPPAGVVFSEWPLSKPDAWAYIRPILAENGGWAFFIYTPRGNNHGRAMYDLARGEKDWFCQLLTADETGVFSPEQLAAERREMVAQYGPTRGEALFQQEYYCSWREAFTGKVVYPEFNQQVHVANQALLPVVVDSLPHHNMIVRGWDNTGLHPGCVVTYLHPCGTWMVVKEFWQDDVGIVEFCEMVKAWCGQHLPRATYRDIGDPAGSNARDMRKKTAADYMREQCAINIVPGIQTFKVRRESVVSRMHRRDGLLIDPGCTLLIDGFAGGYCYSEIGKGTGIYADEPEKKHKSPYHDVHDALQYPATLLFGPVSVDDESACLPEWTPDF